MNSSKIKNKGNAVFFLCVAVMAITLLAAQKCNAMNGPVTVGAGSGSYTVTLDANGGKVSTGTLSVTLNSTYGKLPVPTRNYYQFQGWYSLKHGGSKITGDSTVTKAFDHTLYARWLGKEDKITLIYNDGVTKSSTVAVRYGTRPNLPSPSRTNYNFTGWYTSASGGDKVSQTAVFNEKSKKTLYARWEVKALKIEFIAFNGTGDIYKMVYCGKEYGTLPVPQKEGKKFAGWFTWEDYGDLDAKPVTDKTIVTEKDKRKLFARWE